MQYSIEYSDRKSGGSPGSNYKENPELTDVRKQVPYYGGNPRSYKKGTPGLYKKGSPRLYEKGTHVQYDTGDHDDDSHHTESDIFYIKSHAVSCFCVKEFKKCVLSSIKV